MSAGENFVIVLMFVLMFVPPLIWLILTITN